MMTFASTRSDLKIKNYGQLMRNIYTERGNKEKKYSFSTKDKRVPHIFEKKTT